MFFSKKKIKIAITPRFHQTEIDELVSIEKKYYKFFSKYNCDLYLIPFVKSEVEDYLESLKPDGIVFAGGYRMYTDEIKNFEEKVIKISLKLKLPILAICCGMWTVNGYFGGTLKFNENHQAFDGEKINTYKMLHKVFSDESIIKKDVYTVNTFHSKVIDKLAKNLHPFLFSEDKEIEGIVDKENSILGVQFHMENTGVSGSLTKQIMSYYFKSIKESNKL